MKKFFLASAALVALAAGAQAADLGSPRMPIAAAVVSPVFNWTGFYLGAHLGYGSGSTGWVFLTGPATTVPSNPKGAFGGLQLGYNWQINNFVLGLETDLSIAGFRDSDPCPNPAVSCFTRSNWVGTTRARVGVAADKALFYVTGGLAYGDTRVGASTAVGVTTSRTRVGFALGGGLEYAFTPNVTAKVEYMYYNLGSSSYQVTTVPEFVRARFEYHTVKVGLNYLFSTGPSAVVARY